MILIDGNESFEFVYSYLAFSNDSILIILRNFLRLLRAMIVFKSTSGCKRTAPSCDKLLAYKDNVRWQYEFNQHVPRIV